MERILVTGSVGQIGSELTLALRERYGNDNVVAGGRKTQPSQELRDSGPFEIVDCTDIEAVNRVVVKYRIDTIYHLAALLSAVAENNPQLAWQVNVNALVNVLEVAREHNCAVFTPSSIGAFGPTTPADNTPQDTIQRPTSMYGVTKVSGELLCDYYHEKFGVDTRGLRYPGIISYVTLPGGGTTDYAVQIFYDAIKHGRYTCFLKQGTKLDMMYMPDAIKGAIAIMEADPKGLKHRNAFQRFRDEFRTRGHCRRGNEVDSGVHHGLRGGCVETGYRRFLAQQHGRRCCEGGMGLATGLRFASDV